MKEFQSSLHLMHPNWTPYETTPFAEAVRFQKREAIQLFQNEMGFVSNTVKVTDFHNGLFFTLINAASEVGDIEMIENLLHQISCAPYVPHSWKLHPLLTSCFPLATLGDYGVVINKLLENGVYPEDLSCLMSALIVRDQTLVRLFLDLAVPLGDDPTLIWLAVRWGHLEVIQDLIDAGASLHGYAHVIAFIDSNLHLPSPFTNSLGEALRKQDRQVTQLLIRNGVDFGTERSSPLPRYSPLTVAVQSGDICTV